MAFDPLWNNSKSLPVPKRAFILSPKSKFVPSKVKFASPFKLVPLPPVMTLLSALLDNVAEPEEPAAP